MQAIPSKTNFLSTTALTSRHRYGGFAKYGAATLLGLAASALMPAPASAACTKPTGSTYVCDNPETEGQTVAEDNASVTAEAGFSVDTAVGTALSITGNGALSYADIEGVVLSTDAGSPGLTVSAAGDAGAVAGSVTIVTDGDIAGGVDGIEAKNRGGGAVAVTANGVVTGNRIFGIEALNEAGSDLTIVTGSESAIFGGTDGIQARNLGSGALDIAIGGTVEAGSFDGIDSQNLGTDLTISTAATSRIEAADDAIVADNQGSGQLSITAGGVVAGGGYGIQATNRGTALVIATGAGSMVSGETRNGIDARNDGSGGIGIDVGGTVAGALNGVRARNIVGGATTVTIGGTVTGTAFDGVQIRNGIETPEARAAQEGLTDTVVTIAAGAVVTGGQDGLDIGSRGTGALRVTSDGAIVGKGQHGILADAWGSDLIVAIGASSEITGEIDGIQARNFGSGAADIVIGGIVAGSTFDGLDARNSGTDLNITMAAGSSLTGADDGIAAINEGTGDTVISIQGTVAGTADAAIHTSTIGGGEQTVIVGETGSVAGGRYGIWLEDAATVTVAAGGTVTGGRHGVWFDNPGSITNRGAVRGTDGIAVDFDIGGIELTTGAIAIAGAGVSIVNSGIIAGGFVDGAPQIAIALNEDNNRLELQDGSEITGLVIMTDGSATNNVFALGGSADSIFDTAALGQQYVGFTGFEKTGDSVWTLTGGTDTVTPWAILDGTLAVSSDEQLGGLSSALTLDGGALRITGTDFFETARSLVLGNAGGTLDITDATNRFAVTQALTGTGALSKTGAGTLVLTGANSYGGGTTIAAGTLEGDTSSLQGDITDNATLVFAQQADGRFDGIISGSGQLVKRGTGALLLTGANSYAGGTLVEEGVLQGDSSSLQGDIANNAVLSFVQQTDGLFDGAVSGSGRLVKEGAGTLTLTGINNHSGGTLVEEGVLIGSAVSIGGDLVNNATTVFDQTSDANFSGDVSGGGSTIKTGAGLLVLTGTSSLAWTIEGGSLESAAARFTGDVAIGQSGAFVFDQDSDAGYAGAITGTGDFGKTGAGALTLTGDNGGYDGTTQVQSGLLQVDGVLGGALSVRNGGALGGSGRVGALDIADGGRLVGRQGATLSMAQLTLGSGSVIEAALGAPGTTALFDVAGDLTLDGILNVSDAGGFGAGVYRLFDYGGTLTDNGMTLGTTGGADASALIVQTAAAGQVNLVNATGVDLLFWDGGDAARYDNGVIDGGGGSWTAVGRAWTTADGTVNSAMAPQPGFAVFQGAGGTVTVDNGDGAVSATGMQFAADGYTLAGGPLMLSGSSATIRVGDGTAAGADMTATIAAELTGAASLVKSDLGTLILTGANSYTGNTVVDAGVLIGDTDSIRGDLINKATTVFDQTGDASFAGDVSGAGSTVKAGAGVLTLTGMSSADWSIEEGGMISSSDRFTGDLTIAEGARFTFDQIRDGDYTGQIAGAGDLGFEGDGVVRLSGDSSDFRGTATIAGALSVNGLFGGSVDVLSGGRLQGDGAVGGARVAGTIAPGNSIGTLTIDGDLTMLPTGVYEVEANADGQSDRIAVSGSAVLDGGVTVLAGDGDYAPETDYIIVTASDGLTGTFDTVTANLAFLDPSLSYGSDTVTLRLTRNAIELPDVALTRNQRAVAPAVDALAVGNPIFDAVLGQSADGARAAFDALSGADYASMRGAMAEETRFLRDAVLARGQDADTEGLAVWGQALGAWGDVDSDGNAEGFDRSTEGLLTGFDGAIGEHWRAGAVFGYGTAELRSDAGDEQNAKSLQAGAYLNGSYDRLIIQLGASYAWHDVTAQRSVAIGDFRDSLRAEYNMRTAQIFGEVAWRAPIDDVQIEPFAGVAHVWVLDGATRETGGPAALTIDGRDWTTIFGNAGVRMGGAWSLGGMRTRLKGAVSVRQVLKGRVPTIDLAFAEGAPFTVAGAPIARTALAADLGVDLQLTDRLSLGASYLGQYSSRGEEHGARARLSWAF